MQTTATFSEAFACLGASSSPGTAVLNRRLQGRENSLEHVAFKTLRELSVLDAGCIVNLKPAAHQGSAKLLAREASMLGVSSLQGPNKRAAACYASLFIFRGGYCGKFYEIAPP